MPYSSTFKSPEPNVTARKIGYVLGPLFFLLSFLLPPPDAMSIEGWRVCGLSLWMAVWWITEAMPLPVTSLLPVVVLPVGNILPMEKAISSFSSPIIFLFLGGFIISLAMEKWNLHLRIGLGILKTIGVGGKSILAGIMIATAFLGMWISNTATVIMMLPMAVSIATLLSSKQLDGTAIPLGENSFAKAMILGVAYSCVIGGLATFVGAPVNAVLQSYLRNSYDYSFSLSQWMMFGVPLALILLFFTWLILSQRYMRNTEICGDVRGIVKDAFGKLGPMCAEEKLVMSIFALVASLWIFSKPLEHMLGVVLDDAVIGIFGGILLFLIPADRSFKRFALSWQDTSKLQWGILVFFGGSLALSDALSASGVTNWISTQLVGMKEYNIILVVGLVTLLIIAVTEFMSNVATITAFIPILAALAQAMGINPLLILVPATLAASTGFALPGASAANALAYGTGHLKIRDLIKTGFIFDIVCLGMIVLFTFTLVSWAFNIETGVMPTWAMPK